MMKAILLSALLCLSASTYAQISSENNPSNYQFFQEPDVLIKGEELKNFPGTDLREMLLGRLPGVGLIDVNNSAVKLTYLVDGLVWEDINSLNIHNIEEIAYYRGGLSGKLGFQNTSVSGIMVIRTKSGNYRRPLTAELNTLTGNNHFAESPDKRNSLLQSYQLMLSQGSEKFAWRASGAFSKGGRSQQEYDLMQRGQFNADLKYQPVSWIDFSLKGNYAPASGNEDHDYRSESGALYANNYDFKEKDWNGMVAVNIRPTKGLINETRFFSGKVSDDLQNLSVAERDLGMQGYKDEFLSEDRWSRSVLVNNLSYLFNLAEDRLKFKATAVYQYQNLKWSNYMRTSRVIPPNVLDTVMVSRTIRGNHAKAHTLMADLTIDVFDVLQLDAGLRRDMAAGESDEKALNSPFVRGDLRLKPLFFKELNVLNSLNLFAAYSSYLSPVSVSNMPFSGTVDIGFPFGPVLDNEDKMKVWNFGLKAAFLDNRLSLATDFYVNDNFSYVNFGAAYPYSSSSFYAQASLRSQGWRVWTDVEILRDVKFKWKMGLNVFSDEAKLSFPPSSGITFESAEQKATLQLGVQQGFGYAGFRLDMNGYAVINQPGTIVSNQYKSGKRYALNYACLGYGFKEVLGMKSLNFGLVFRNGIAHDEYLYAQPLTKTYGLALNLSL